MTRSLDILAGSFGRFERGHSLSDLCAAIFYHGREGEIEGLYYNTLSPFRDLSCNFVLFVVKKNTGKIFEIEKRQIIKDVCKLLSGDCGRSADFPQ
jgi:hypothetical protein